MKLWWGKLSNPQRAWFIISLLAILCHAGWLIIGFLRILHTVFEILIAAEIVLMIVWWIMLARYPNIVRRPI